MKRESIIKYEIIRTNGDKSIRRNIHEILTERVITKNRGDEQRCENSGVLQSINGER